jgi:hypothetical protein
MHAFIVAASGSVAFAPFTTGSWGVRPSAPSTPSLAVTSHRTNSAATSATATAMDDPPFFAADALAATTAKFSTFASSAPLASVSAIWSAGPLSMLFAACDQVQSFAQANPPNSSTPAEIVTASTKGALAHAYTRLSPALSSASWSVW